MISFLHHPRDVHPQRANVVAVYDGARGARELDVCLMHAVHLQIFHRLHHLFVRVERQLQRDGVHDVVFAPNSPQLRAMTAKSIFCKLLHVAHTHTHTHTHAQKSMGALRKFQSPTGNSFIHSLTHSLTHHQVLLLLFQSLEQLPQLAAVKQCK